MDIESMRAQLDEFRAQLRRNEDEHEILVSLVKGHEGWLRLYAKEPTEAAAQLPLSPSSTPKPVHSSTPKGSVSMRSAVKEVLTEAAGTPMHSKDILAAAMAKGAVTTGQDAQAIVDLTLYSLRNAGVNVEKVAPRTWVFRPTEENKTPAAS